MLFGENIFSVQQKELSNVFSIFWKYARKQPFCNHVLYFVKLKLKIKQKNYFISVLFLFFFFSNVFTKLVITYSFAIVQNRIQSNLYGNPKNVT